MKTIKRNEGFKCAYCGHENPPAEQTCRNHCRQCLCSQHVDDQLPGDRKSNCGGKMRPVGIEPDTKKEWIIIHQCETCGKVGRNKAASDDEYAALLQIAQTAADEFMQQRR